MKENDFHMLKEGNEYCPSVEQHFLCCITLDVMTDPVITSEGWSYDRNAIIRALNNAYQPMLEHAQEQVPVGEAPAVPTKLLSPRRNELLPFSLQDGSHHLTVTDFLRENVTLQLLIQDYTHSKHSFLPVECYCPISHVMMHDPVVADDGYTYEHGAIFYWVTSHGTSPITGHPMRPNFISNRVLKNFIDASQSFAKASCHENISSILRAKSSDSFKLLQARADFDTGFRETLYKLSKSLHDMDVLYGSEVNYLEFLRKVPCGKISSLLHLKFLIPPVCRFLRLTAADFFNIPVQTMIDLLENVARNIKLLPELNELLDKHRLSFKEIQKDWPALQEDFTSVIRAKRLFALNNSGISFAELANVSSTQRNVFLGYVDGTLTICKEANLSLLTFEVCSIDCLVDILSNPPNFLTLYKHGLSLEEMSTWDEGFREIALTKTTEFLNCRSLLIQHHFSLKEFVTLSGDQLLAVLQLPPKQLIFFLQATEIPLVKFLATDGQCQKQILAHPLTVIELLKFGVSFEKLTCASEDTRSLLLDNSLKFVQLVSVLQHILFPELSMSGFLSDLDLDLLIIGLETYQQKLLYSTQAIAYVNHDVKRLRTLLSSLADNTEALLQIHNPIGNGLVHQNQQMWGQFLGSCTFSVWHRMKAINRGEHQQLVSLGLPGCGRKH